MWDFEMKPALVAVFCVTHANGHGDARNYIRN